MWPAIAALGGAALGVIGQRNANRENRLQQERFASEGIRMRVEDAKAAGLHPLFALGANVPGYSPSAQNVFDSSFGQNISRAASQFSSEERELRAAQLEAVKASAARDYAQAAAFSSEAARARQESVVSNPVQFGFDPVTGAQTFPVGGYGKAVTREIGPADQLVRGQTAVAGVKYNPQEHVVGGGSAGSDVTPGVGRNWMKVQVFPGTEFLLPMNPQGDVSQVWESIGESMGLAGLTAVRNFMWKYPEAYMRIKEHFSKRGITLPSLGGAQGSWERRKGGASGNW